MNFKGSQVVTVSLHVKPSMNLEKVGNDYCYLPVSMKIVIMHL